MTYRIAVDSNRAATSAAIATISGSASGLTPQH
jgi:hypothetical protein